MHMPRSARPSVETLIADLLATRERLKEVRAEQERLNDVQEQQMTALAARLCPFAQGERVPLAPNVLLQVSDVKINLDDPQHPTWVLKGYRRSYGPGKHQGATGLRDWLTQTDYEALPDTVRAQTHESLVALHAPRVELDKPLRLSDPMRSLLSHARTFFGQDLDQAYVPSGVNWGSPSATKKIWLGLVQQGVVILSGEAQANGVTLDSDLYRWSLAPGPRYPDALKLMDTPRIKPFRTLNRG